MSKPPLRCDAGVELNEPCDLPVTHAFIRDEEDDHPSVFSCGKHLLDMGGPQEKRRPMLPLAQVYGSARLLSESGNLDTCTCGAKVVEVSSVEKVSIPVASIAVMDRGVPRRVGVKDLGKCERRHAVR